MPKPKIALYWCASCGGCEEAVVDLAERILDLASLVDVVFWPVALDFKVDDVEKLEDGSIDISFINGGIRLTEHEHMARLLRRKSKIVVAYGACSAWGGIPGLANLYNVKDIMSRLYIETPTVQNVEGILPSANVHADSVELKLPEVLPRLVPLNGAIEVDYYIPGCPPTPDVTWRAVEALLSEDRPPRGSVMGASQKALCDECPLNSTKPDRVLLKELRRPHGIIPDAEKCLLAQGLLCMGPGTRGGCDALCVKARMPCTGCFGPLESVTDHGGKLLSSIASTVDFQDSEEIEKALGSIGDPVGVFYRYYLAASSMRGRVGAS